MSLLPLGHKSGMFFDARSQNVADCIVKWGNEEAFGRTVVAKHAKMSLSQAFEFVAVREFSPTRSIVISFGHDGSAFFDNQSYEFVSAAELFNVCRLLKTRGYFFSHNDSEGSEQRGSANFLGSSFRGDGVQERNVILYKENGWTFAQSGDPLPFENLEAYGARKKRDRLNADILREYGAALGIPFWDETQYGDDVYLLNWGERPADEESALKKITGIFGHPAFIMDRHGIRRPPQ